MQRARSRLDKTTASQKPSLPKEESRSKELSKKRAKKNKSITISNTLFGKYLKHLPLLLLSLPWYYGVYTLMQKFYPAELADVLMPDLYLAIQAPLFVGNFFLFSYLFLNTRRGFLLSAFTAVLLFLKLKHVLFAWWWVLSLLIFFVILELVLRVAKKYSLSRR